MNFLGSLIKGMEQHKIDHDPFISDLMRVGPQGAPPYKCLLRPNCTAHSTN